MKATTAIRTRAAAAKKTPVAYRYSYNPYSSYCATVMHPLEEDKAGSKATPATEYYAQDAPETTAKRVSPVRVSPSRAARNAGSSNGETEGTSASRQSAGPLRTDLHSQLEFLAFPPNAYYRGPLRRAAPPREHRAANLVQLFFGQLPFRLTDAMVLYLFDTVAQADAVYIERIVQDNSKKGCMQIYVYEEDVDKVVAAFHKRVLFDQTGVWIAHTEEQRAWMQQHGDNGANRFKGLPFYPMVVERSRQAPERRRWGKSRSFAFSKPAAAESERSASVSTSATAAAEYDDYDHNDCDRDIAPPEYGDVPPPPAYKYACGGCACVDCDETEEIAVGGGYYQW